MSEILVASIIKIIEWVLLAGVEFFAVYYGVKLTFQRQSRKEGRAFHKRVTKIVPHIYIELYENLKLMTTYQGYGHYYRNALRFKIAFWEVYQSELAEWEQHDVVPLTMIYYNMKRINQHLDAGIETTPSDFHHIMTENERLINQKLEEYEIWFQKRREPPTPDPFSEFKKVFEQYQKRHFSSSILKYIQDRMEKKGLIIQVQ